MTEIIPMPPNYAEFLESVKRTIQQARIRTYRSISRELINLYWSIGKAIAERQERDRKSVV